MNASINALFKLECQCILDGCHDSSPGLAWTSGKTGLLYCVKHKKSFMLIDVVILNFETETSVGENV